ncbi:hypothetical protein ABFV99_13940 [Cytobacillus horneckiae]|uniref:hypothetical protein n=1 Tax=Cytobacillus horneckiae TaxID=549687 RepID=UPI0034CD90EA
MKNNTINNGAITSATKVIMERLSQQLKLLAAMGKHLESSQEKANLIGEIMIDTINDHTIGTGNTFIVDIMELHEKTIIELEKLVSMMDKYIDAIQIENKVMVEKKSKYVFVFECNKKVQKIMNLSPIQKMIYELYDVNRADAVKALEMISSEERKEVQEVLAFERYLRVV